MKIRPRLTTLACCVAAALSQMAAGAALADSAVGVDTVLGNALNPSPDPTRPLDPNYPAAKHTPTGQLYNIPYALPNDLHKSATGWEYSGQVEIGGLGGDANEKNAQFRMYKDLRNGLYLNNFGFQAEKPDQAYFVELLGGGVARDDQYYGLQFGRYNDWKLKAFYNETPHVFTHTYGTLWSGIGTGNLTLLPPLTPGGSGLGNPTDNANIQAVALASNSALSVTRKKGGVRYDLNLSDAWKGYASYSLENREGARPFGAAWGVTSSMEIAEGVDNKTHELLAGLQYADALSAFNLRLSASLFRNSIDTLTFEEPNRIPNPAGVTTIPAAGAFTRGRFDMHPDNEAYNVKAEYARSLPDFYKGRFTGVVSLGTHRQDDNLIPYTPIPNLTLANVTLLPGGNWDSTGSLSRQSAGARIDTRLVDLGLALNPTDALNVKGKLRYYQRDNKTEPFLACNRNATYIDTDPNTAGNQPGALTLDGCTGAWGRIYLDGAGQSVLMGTSSARAGNLIIKSIPFEFKQYNAGLSADYRLDKVSSLNAAYERESFHREHRERDKTWEDKFKFGYVNRGLPDSTLRLSYEYGNRRGGTYVAAPYEEFVSAEFFPIPTGPAGTSVTSWAVHTNNALRKLDLADRKQHILNGRLNTMLQPNLDAGATLQVKLVDFPDSAYGRTKQNQNSINFDLNYQPSATRVIYGFYSYQQGKIDQALISTQQGSAFTGTCRLGVEVPLGASFEQAAAICASPGGPIYPLSSAWSATSKDRNDVLGLGLKQDFGKARLDLNFIRSEGRAKLGYAYTPGGAVSLADAPFAGSGMPDITIIQNILEASLVVPVDKRVAVRLLYRYESGKIRDWHYHNIEGSPVVVAPPGTALPVAVVLDGGPQDFHANVFGVLFQIKM